MDVLIGFLATLGGKIQSPTLAFLIGGMLLSALGSRLEIPDPVYRFIVFALLMKIGLGAGVAVREADLVALLSPALAAILLGAGAVLLGRLAFARLPGVSLDDGLATAGLFGAVSASTLAATMAILDDAGMAYEAWAPALYPFMDIPALVLAIVLSQLSSTRRKGGAGRASVGQVVTESLRSPALSALLLGLALGVLARPEPVLASFYEPLFRGLLSILMLVMGMEAWLRLAEMRKVAQYFVLYALVAPFAHGLAGFGLGWVAHELTGFSPGGVVILAVMAASSSDISGPPTLRAGIPGANPAAYVGSSTGIGTPVALLSIPLYVALADLVFAL